MKKIFIQGDRDATGIEQEVLKIGKWAKESGIILYLGAYGKIVELAASTGATCICHTIKSKNIQFTFDQQNVTIVESNDWFDRLRYLTTEPDAFIFFAGRGGTIAHAAPILAHIIKGEIDRGKSPRKVIFLNWEIGKAVDLLKLFDLHTREKWIKIFELFSIRAAWNFISK